jgi:hypothetical protein
MATMKQVSLNVKERRRKVAELFLGGKAQHEIRNLLGLNPGKGDVMVCTDLRAIREEWKRDAVRDFDEAKGKQLAKLEHLERTLWKAWERSCEEFLETNVSKKQVRAGKLLGVDEDGGSEMVDDTITTGVSKGRRDGNPAFTAQILQVIREQAELLGLITKPGEISSSPPVVSFKIVGTSGVAEESKAG